MLVVNIWMFYSKSLNCCLEARAFLGCSPITAEPCMGYTGDCADLPTVFAGIHLESAPGIPDDYVCLQFPNDDSQRDSLILGLISWACSLPVVVLILNVFWNANAPDYDPAWLRWDFQRRMLLGRAEWRYSPPGDAKRPNALRRCTATTWGVNWHYNAQQYLIERPTAFFFRAAQRRRARRGLPELEPSDRLGAGLMTQIKMQLFCVLGVASTYLVWAIMSWIIFTYGSLVYRLMGDSAQQKFAEGWAVGLAISQATQFKARPQRHELVLRASPLAFPSKLCCLLASDALSCLVAGHVDCGAAVCCGADGARDALARCKQAVAGGAHRLRERSGGAAGARRHVLVAAHAQPRRVLRSHGLNTNTSALLFAMQL